MKKDIRNADAVVYKFKPALIKAINDKLEVVKKKKQKKEKMIEKRKAKAMAAKQRKIRKGISLYIKKENENDTGDNTDQN